MMLTVGGLAFLAAGAIKGVVGIGLPTASMGLLTLSLPPRTAIALMLFPMILSNLWQLIRSGDVRGAIHRYRRFASVLFVTVACTVVLTQNAGDRVLLAVLGVTILLFVSLSVKGWVPRLPDRWDPQAQIVFGGLTGLLGGLTSGWAAPLMIYLGIRKIPKDEYIRATGLLIFVGSVPLALSYLSLGLMDMRLTLLSLVMLVPTFAGFSAGERLRNRLSVEAFRTVILAVFAVLALNLLRRAIWYG